MCHRLACQRRTGGPFSLQARWRSDQVTIEGTPQEYKLVGDAGSTATFRFCPICSTTVYFDNDAMPGTVAVPVGAFADPTFPPPTISVYGNRRHPWVLVPNLAAEELD